MLVPLLHTANGPYQFTWHLHPDVVLLCIFLLAGYFYAITQLRDLVSDAGRVKRSQVVWYCSGVASLYLVAGTPVHDISEQYLLTAHMFQHTTFTMISAPLLLMGIPGWMWQALLRPRGMLAAGRVLTHPVVAFGVFNALFVGTHLPEVTNYALYHHWFHLLVHVALVASALLMWWPVLSNVADLPRLGPPLRMSYLFVQSVLPTVVAAFVTFADGAVYSFYQKAPRMWGITAVEDQQIAGGVMKLMGSLILWGLIAVIFFQWYAQEQAQDESPASWPEIEDELEALGLTGGRR
ncbi:MAG: cytochrome c oxidase assembly protein [Chloroflexi bacterium]|nr:cytochrome c oxidase assembly protein [Chloroflexota bacterium]